MKSNSAYMAIDAALEAVRKTGDQPVPLHLRNAPTSLMKDLGYGKDYKYSHEGDNHYIAQQYMPDKLKGSRFWNPCRNASENKLQANLKLMKGES